MLHGPCNLVANFTWVMFVRLALDDISSSEVISILTKTKVKSYERVIALLIGRKNLLIFLGVICPI